MLCISFIYAFTLLFYLILNLYLITMYYYMIRCCSILIIFFYGKLLKILRVLQQVLIINSDFVFILILLHCRKLNALTHIKTYKATLRRIQVTRFNIFLFFYIMNLHNKILIVMYLILIQISLLLFLVAHKIIVSFFTFKVYMFQNVGLKYVNTKNFYDLQLLLQTYQRKKLTRVSCISTHNNNDSNQLY